MTIYRNLPPPPVAGIRLATPPGRTARRNTMNVSIGGHRTSLTLEPVFQEQLRAIAAAQGMRVGELLTEIDVARSKGQSLSSAVRVFVATYLAELATRAGRAAR